MARMKWQVPEELVGALQDAANKLDYHLTDLESQHEDMSDRWRESERGEAIREWVEEWQNRVREVLDTADELDDSREPEL